MLTTNNSTTELKIGSLINETSLTQFDNKTMSEIYCLNEDVGITKIST